MILDPTCGSGTTAYRRGTMGTTMDHNRHLPSRAGARPAAAYGRSVPLVPAGGFGLKGAPKRTELSGAAAAAALTSTNDIRHGFVYERVPHITLSSIANNPDIKEGMSRGRSTRPSSDTPIRAALRQALRGHEEGASLWTIHSREPVAPHRSFALRELRRWLRRSECR